MKYGLVLAGGGVRGAYHIGVWKALRELGIEITAAAGTSIGAVNAALAAQGEYEAAQKLWRTVSPDMVVALPKTMHGGKNIFAVKNLKEIALQIYKNGGLDMSPFEKLLRSVIDEEKIRQSRINLGITAFSLTDRQEIYKFIEDIPRGKLIDYLMASVCTIGFGVKTVASKRLIDGGMINNMPINMMLDKGIDNIIAVDAHGIGRVGRYNLRGKNVIKIRCGKPHNGIMEFDRGGIEKSIAEGYIDCMKKFGAAEGEIYSFFSHDYRRALGMYSHEIISGIEYAASVFGVDKLKIYKFDEFTDRVINEYEKRIAAPDFKGDSRAMQLVQLMEKCGGRASYFGKISDAASALLYFLK